MNSNLDNLHRTLHAVAIETERQVNHGPRTR